MMKRLSGRLHDLHHSCTNQCGILFACHKVSQTFNGLCIASLSDKDFPSVGMSVT